MLAINNPIEHYLTKLDIPVSLRGVERVNYMIQRHLSLFAFSSVNVILDRDLSLDIESIVERIVVGKQGGYCFEHNKLMQSALEYLGYSVRPILARVLLNGDELNRRSHRVTLLSLDGENYLVDVGFGLATPREALVLQSQQYTWHNQQVRLSAIENQDYRVEQREQDNWQTLYRFDLSETTETDCDASHFYTHKHPQSNFVNNLVVSKVHSNTRELVKRLELFEYDDQAGTERSSTIKTAKQLHQILSQQLGLNINVEEARYLFDHQMQRAH
ncbi:arylamine N-acetyltransferase [Vibrio sp. 404]|uniref:Arylamine N-acetyltransferase n=1 Tax=Vibrio marinisediminis TaxID=2758441 RepID=A0A7W2ISA7_9VIBR|nr:arylamine N-acetyltransferase [Vibrio marinisediminis]MBA5761139.1 arylamine N-acetyltransferase [Vibrio marinisediminis]